MLECNGGGGARWRAWMVRLFLLAATAAAQSSLVLRGTVVDPAGALVPGATVKSDCSQASVVTDGRGEFAIRCDSVARAIRVTAEGFVPVEVKVADPQSDVNIHLRLPATWTSARVVDQSIRDGAMGESAQSVRMISEKELMASPQPTLDDALRGVAGFSLFRRSGSRVANPTSQGVSLRGIGASGASRALVLYDEVPLNDPFGGWVYWYRVSPLSVSAVEVTQSGGSDFYGDQALAGVINIERRSPQSSLRINSEGGSFASFSESASGGKSLGPVHISGFFDLGATGGYILVPVGLRGGVDTPANTRHSSGELRFDGAWKRMLLFVQGSGFGERRHNGTPLQTNDTQMFGLSAGLDRSAGSGNLVVRVDGSGQSYNQSFSSIASDRDSETLSRLQHVPAQQFGARAVWGSNLHAHLFSFGGDVRQVQGFTHETIFVSGKSSSGVVAGGKQFFGGAFGQDLWKVTARLTVGATFRVDGWRNLSASSTTTPVATPTLLAITRFPDRSEVAFDPRLSAMFHANDRVSLFATGYRSFRAPRLNELYRAFRLGNVLTLANSALQAERLTGLDAGVGVDGNAVNARATFFFARVSHPIANVTQATTPTLITRQRQNAGALESKGLQLTASATLRRDWTLRGDYQFADSTVTAFAPNPVLVGKRVPQVPAHTFAASLTFRRDRWTAVLNGRLSSRQFDDDLNAFDLGAASSFDVYVSRQWNEHVETFASAENLLDHRDLVARTPTPNLSLPRSARVGVRFTIGNEPRPTK